MTTGLYLSAGGSSWNTLSDREQKSNFAQVNSKMLLDKLSSIEISSWNYKDQDPSIRHVGPTAQDFNALLPFLGGEGATFINSLDADGVALAAIQGLYELVQQQQVEIDRLKQLLNGNGKHASAQAE
jgi:hypothetical protein